MKKTATSLGCLFLMIGLNSLMVHAQEKSTLRDSIAVHFNGDASVEVGSPYVGLEFHHSSPLPQRVSFYYPVANSIDLSNDYWTRDQTYSMALALKEGDKKSEWIGLDPFEMELTPYEVTFTKKEPSKEISIRYQFTKDRPAFVISYNIKNTSSKAVNLELYTDLQASLKTSHTFATKDKAWSEFRKEGSVLFQNFEDDEVQNVQLFAGNIGLQPTSFSAVSELDSLPASEKWWSGMNTKLNGQTAKESSPKTPAFRYRYSQHTLPGESLEVVQVIGSAKKGEGYELVSTLLKTAKEEVLAYEQQVLDYTRKNTFQTGDKVLDHSVLWANSILDVNRHYIDGSIQPMPCPAEYNFYFTHDVLLTDLAAVNFDLPRVKQDLEFITSHADSNYVIPHAYYWKDNKYATEFAPPDNWNHYWYVITSGSYLRHSGDTDFLKKLYPYLSKSVNDFKTHKKNDIIYSYRPDWWDIARNFGPRSYTTILAIKALKEYLYISSTLGVNQDSLLQLEKEIEEMELALNEQLWSEEQEYLINYFEDGTLDEHYYIGSLLGSHYNLLNQERKEKLTATAEQKIVDPKIGVYTVYPMDFQNLIEYLKLAGNEAGDPFYYINGGIWPHGNAWYALSLMEIGKQEEALQFIKRVMTVDGAINSPNGQPAMYEYRVSDKGNPSVYGKIDKPQFTWAAGWYLYSLYNLFGVKETEWNIRIEPYTNEELNAIKFNLSASGSKYLVRINGEGNSVQRLTLNDKPYNSLVLPNKLETDFNTLEIQKGKLETPLLTQVNAILNSISYLKSEQKLEMSITSFKSHSVTMHIQSTEKPVSVIQNGANINSWSSTKKDDVFYTEIRLEQSNLNDKLQIQF
tara:strand:+ start:7145 stop:9715 length:2571 start_codon:yes stop_codon:yes gene_type:complete